MRLSVIALLTPLFMLTACADEPLQMSGTVEKVKYKDGGWADKKDATTFKLSDSDAIYMCYWYEVEACSLIEDGDRIEFEATEERKGEYELTSLTFM